MLVRNPEIHFPERLAEAVLPGEQGNQSPRLNDLIELMSKI